MESWLKSTLQVKCPRCRKGRMFLEGTLYDFNKFGKMNDKCSCCEQSFEPEPGYYFGAMFISYAFNTAYFFGVWLLFSFSQDYGTLEFMSALVLVALVLFPMTFRWSRVLWLNIFIHYDGSLKCSKT